MRAVLVLLIGFLAMVASSKERVARALADQELVGSQRFLHGPNFEMLNAPSDNAQGRLTILPPGLPAPYFEGGYYKSPYPNDAPKKKLQRPEPRNDEPSG